MALVPAAASQGDTPPATATAQQRVQGLIKQLGDGNYSVRERAQVELGKLGFDAFDQLSDAANDDDLEIATRARILLRLMRVQWTRDDDPPEVKKLLEGYDTQPLETRTDHMRRLASLPAAAGIPALCRLVRYEQSAVLSKSAAVAILNREPVPTAEAEKLAKMLRENLSGSRQVAAQWLLAYLDLRKAPKAGLAEWNRLVDVEQAVLRRTPERSSPHIVASLLYDLAVIQADQGLQELADRTAERARQMSPGRSVPELLTHLTTAYALRRRGLSLGRNRNIAR